MKYKTQTGSKSAKCACTIHGLL